MEAIDALIGVLAEALGKKTAELTSELKTGDKYKAGTEIKSYLAPLITEKFKGLVSSDKVEQARGKALKDKAKEIEESIESKFGVSGKLSEGLLDEVHKLTQKPPKEVVVEKEDYENSAAHKALVKSHKAEIKTLKTNHLADLKNEKQERITDLLHQRTLAYVKDPKNKFNLPPDDKDGSNPILDNQVRLMVNDILDYKYEDAAVAFSVDTNRKLLVRDKDDLPLKDSNVNDMGVTDLMHSVATSGYFSIKAGSGRETPPTSPAGGGTTTTVKFGDKEEQTLEVPVFDNQAALDAWTQGEGQKHTPQERIAVRKAHDGKFDNTEN